MSGNPQRQSRDHEAPGDRLRTLASAVARLAPSRRDPEQFHEDKSEIAAELRRLARELAL